MNYDFDELLDEVAAMPVGMDTVHRLQRLFHLHPKIVLNPRFIKLVCTIGGIGSFITNLDSEQTDEMKRFANSLHVWQPNQDSPYKEICTICGQKRRNPEKESIYRKEQLHG